MGAAVTPIIGSVLGSVASTVIGSMLGGDKKSSAPSQSMPSVMPTSDDSSVKLAKQRSIAEQVARRGRASTILTGDTTTEKLGG